MNRKTTSKGQQEANPEMTEMVKAGKLKKEGLDRFPIYVPVPGNYRK